MRCLALILVPALLSVVPARADPEKPPPLLGGPSVEQQMQQAEATLRKGLEQMMGAMTEFLRQVPQYEMPRMDENGDIIIKRKRPEDIWRDGKGRGDSAI